MKEAINNAIRLGEELAKQRNAAHDLWTWLPSCKEATKGHGDYYCEHTPSVSRVLVEATLFISHGLNPTDEQRKEAGDFYRCPCGEDHDTPEADKKEGRDA